MKNLICKGAEYFLPNISIDHVIFGYQDTQLKVLLLQVTNKDWMLPGGYIFRNESVKDAARRILKERIALKAFYIKQFEVFGRADRSYAPQIATLFNTLGIPWSEDLWMNQRFVSLGYYSLVDINRARPTPNYMASACQWFPTEELPGLLLDHKEIAMAAIDRFREDLSAFPIGYHLLPPSFTMPELHRLFETIQRKSMDRSRFQKKMLSYKIFERLDKKAGVPHRSPYLYRVQQ